MAMPLARDVVKDIAISHGGCIRPVQLRRTDLATGETEQVLVPCGHTLASVCPACAERARNLRAAQCREGWHLDHEPDLEPDAATDSQEWWIENRAEVQARRDQAVAAGEDAEHLDQLLGELDEEINRAGMRGKAAPGRGRRRHRSTRRRQDAPPLPRRQMDPRTVGRTYTAPDGKVFRPSLFLTLTCPSYGKVTGDGTPADPDRYDYVAAARDALHFAALFDRFLQNLRRYCGCDLQYFAAIEPQRLMRPADETFASKTEAEDWLTLTEAELLEGDWIDPDASAVLVSDYAATWIEERPGLRPKRVLIYDGLLRSHIAPYFENVTVGEVTLARVRRWRKKLLDSGVSEITAAKAYRLLRAIFNTALDDGLIRRNPCHIKGADRETHQSGQF
jgi:hypothetical protein